MWRSNGYGALSLRSSEGRLFATSAYFGVPTGGSAHALSNSVLLLAGGLTIGIKRSHSLLKTTPSPPHKGMSSHFKLWRNKVRTAWCCVRVRTHWSHPWTCSTAPLKINNQVAFCKLRCSECQIIMKVSNISHQHNIPTNNSTTLPNYRREDSPSHCPTRAVS